jgi:hypothetical protein
MLLSHDLILRINDAILMAADTVSNAIESDTHNTWQTYIEDLLPKWFVDFILVVGTILIVVGTFYLVISEFFKRKESKRLTKGLTRFSTKVNDSERGRLSIHFLPVLELEKRVKIFLYMLIAMLKLKF